MQSTGVHPRISGRNTWMVVMMVRMQTGSSNRIRLEQALDLILAMYSGKKVFFQSALNFIMDFFFSNFNN